MAAFIYNLPSVAHLKAYIEFYCSPPGKYWPDPDTICFIEFVRSISFFEISVCVCDFAVLCLDYNPLQIFRCGKAFEHLKYIKKQCLESWTCETNLMGTEESVILSLKR